MASDNLNPLRNDAVEAAIARVLESEVAARAKVTGKYDKKGHRFVELDALVVANGRTPLAHCNHVAITQPREQAAA